jgi:hypothetical protein
MKKLLVIIFSFLPVGILTAQDIKLDELLEKNYKAIGQDKLEKVQTIRTTGKMLMQGMELTTTSYKQKPHLTYSETEVQGTKVLVRVNGQTGWMVNPLTGSSDTVEMPPNLIEIYTKAEQINPFLNWYDPFVNWKENGSKMELLGKEDMDGIQVYNVKLTPKDSVSVNYFIDATKFVVLKMKTTAKAQGQVFDVETHYSDFRLVDGIMNSFKIESLVNGQVSQQIIFDKCEINIPPENGISKNLSKDEK